MNAFRILRHVIGFLALTLFLSHGQATLAQEAVAPGSHDGSPIQLPSQVMGDTRTFWIHLPASYETASQQHYPVVYLLDGERLRVPFTGITDYLTGDVHAHLPDMIVVGIASADRALDFTPTHVPLEQQAPPFKFAESGGGDRYLEFLESELIPWVDHHYRTRPHRLLVGHSLGGLMTIHAASRKESSFQGYLAIDPSLWWDQQSAIDRWENETPSLSNQRLFVATAAHPDNPNYAALDRAQSRFGEWVKTHNTPQIEIRRFPEDDHGSCVIPAMHRGLLFLFPDYKLEVRTVATQPELLTKHFQQFSEVMGSTWAPPEDVIDWFTSFCRDRNDSAAAQAFEAMKLGR